MSEPLWLWSVRLAIKNWWRRTITYRGQRTLPCDTCLHVWPRGIMRPARLRDASLTLECPNCARMRVLLQMAASDGWRPNA